MFTFCLTKCPYFLIKSSSLIHTLLIWHLISKPIRTYFMIFSIFFLSITSIYHHPPLAHLAVLIYEQTFLTLHQFLSCFFLISSIPSYSRGCLKSPIRDKEDDMRKHRERGGRRWSIVDGAWRTLTDPLLLMTIQRKYRQQKKKT